jgi:S-adenosylmethionine hydrolase
MGRRYDTVSLLTDYGLIDEFVGVVKSVIDIAPHVVTIVTHDYPRSTSTPGTGSARSST